MKIINNPDIYINGIKAKSSAVDYNEIQDERACFETYVEDFYKAKYDFSYQVRKNIRQHIEVEIFKITPIGTVINHCVYKTYQEAIEDFSNLFDHFLRNFYQSVNDNLINPIMENVEIM